MPNLVGSGLQDAQNRIQALTDNAIFFSGSHDGTGAGRLQVVDSNWKVCSQSPQPGATINAQTKIDFGAVKLDESCP
jgi:beta-lactam-binding protein with PASTA domain